MVAQISCLKLEEARLAAELDRELQAARVRFAPRLASLRAGLDGKTEAVRVWAEANRAAFGRLRSLAVPEGVLGWRTSQPALKTLAGWTWDKVLAKLKTLPLMRDYVRTREEVNKQRLLADRIALGAETLQNIGLSITQEDCFFVEPKITVTKIADRQKVAA
jgi:phage host-nuclease inhibitor protein Gam